MGDKRYKMPVAVHLFILRNDEILMLRRYNTGYEDGNYSVVAGHIDENEDFLSAMIREAKEEAGIEIERRDLRPVQVMHRKNKNQERIDFFCIVNRWKGNIVNMEPDKCDRLRWFKIDDLPENTIPYIRCAIRQYQNEESFTLFGWG